MPTNAQMATIARQMEQTLMPEVVEIITGTIVTDSDWGGVERTESTLTTVGSLTPINVRPEERAIGGQETSVSEAWLQLPIDIEITPGDRVTVSGAAYKVLSVQDPESFVWYRRCRVERQW